MQQVWHQLAFPKRGKDMSEFNRRFTDLLHLVGETPATVGPGSQAYNIHERNMDAWVCHTWSSVMAGARMHGEVVTLQQLMMVAEEVWIRTTSGATTDTTRGMAGARPAAPAIPGAGRANATIPGPMEPGAVGARASNRCTRCEGKGHWSHQCGTPAEWRDGDSIAMPPRRGRGVVRGG